MKTQQELEILEVILALQGYQHYDDPKYRFRCIVSGDNHRGDLVPHLIGSSNMYFLVCEKHGKEIHKHYSIIQY
jgi:hypothetical protein